MSCLIKSEFLCDSCGSGGSWAGAVGIGFSLGAVGLGIAVGFACDGGEGDDFFNGLVGIIGGGTGGRESFREDAMDFAGDGGVAGSLSRVLGNGVDESRVGGSGTDRGEGFWVGRSTFGGCVSKGLGLTGAALAISGSGGRFTWGTFNG